MANDSNGFADLFLRDRVAGTTERVNLAFDGSETNSFTAFSAMSDDGRFIAFSSGATNLVPLDNNFRYDVFVRDRQLGTTELATVGVNGVQARQSTTVCGMSGNGRYVVFQTSSRNLVPLPMGLGGLYVRDLWNDTTRMVGINALGANADQGAGRGEFSSDGAVLVYESLSNNLTPNPPNSWSDIFAVQYDQLSPAVYCTPTTSSAGCAASLSWNGTASASAGSGFNVTASGVTPGRPALFLYSRVQPAALPHAGGTLCMEPPLARTSVTTATGVGPCGGSVSQDFNAWIATGTDPALRVGTPVWLQCWSRDPGSASSLNLSDALFFVIDP